MKTLKILVVFGVLLAVWLAIPVMIWLRSQPNTLTLELNEELRQAKLQAAKSLLTEKTALEKAKLQTAIRREWMAADALLFFQEAKKYTLISSVSVVLTTILVIAAAFGKRLSTLYVQLEEHVRIPVKYRDLKNSMPLATQYLSTKEAAALSENRQEAFQMFVQLAQTAAAFNKSLPAQMVNAPAALPAASFEAIAAGPVPTVKNLLTTGMIAPGKPFVMGFSQTNEPQFRARDDIKALAIAGSQGSGKTYSMAYLVSSILYQIPDALVYVIDPHSRHEKSLTALIAPLAQCDRLKLINPVDTYTTLSKLERLLDARLSGLAPSEPAIFLVIDEMARLVTSLEDDHLDAFISFLARCTEETRKANMTVIGGSVKWKARYFKNRADIREGMESFLIHKTKPSLADLLLEDAREKKMVKGLTLPGQCLLATSHDADPQIVQMPLITKQDIQQITQLISNGAPVVINQVNVDQCVESVDLPDSTAVECVDLNETDAQFLAKIKRLKDTQQWTHGELSRLAKVDKGLLSKILNNKEPLTSNIRKNLENLLSTAGQQESTSNVIPFQKKH